MKQTLFVAASLLLMGAGAAVSAREPALPKDLPPYGADKPVPVPQIDKHTLANGMTLWIVADKEGVPKVNYVLAVRGGTAADPRELNGLWGILARTLDEGTRSRSSIQIAQELQGLGASLGGSAGSDGTTVSASGLSSNARPLMELLADVVRNPTFPDHEIDLAKANALQELKAAQATPGYGAVTYDEQYAQFKPQVEGLFHAQERLCNRFLKEAEDLMKKLRPEYGSTVQEAAPLEQEIGLLLYRVKVGQPKSAGLLKQLEDPENLRLMNQAELLLPKG